MEIIVTIEGLTPREAAGAARKLRLFNSLAGIRLGEPTSATVEDVYARQIGEEVARLADEEEAENIARLSGVGRVLLQLPEDDQAELVDALKAKAVLRGVDASGLGE